MYLCPIVMKRQLLLISYLVLFPQTDPCVTSPVSPGLDVVVPHCVNSSIPSLLSMPTRNHMDITTPPLPLVAPEVLRVAEHRHKKASCTPTSTMSSQRSEVTVPSCHYCKLHRQGKESVFTQQFPHIG